MVRKGSLIWAGVRFSVSERTVLHSLHDGHLLIPSGKSKEIVLGGLVDENTKDIKNFLT